MKDKNKKLGVILLGAGNSRRFGGRKQFFKINGEMMYFSMMKKLAAIPNTEKILVTQFEEMKEEAKQYGFIPVMNEEPERGISSSIRLGIQALYKRQQQFSGILFAVCDQPYLSLESLERLVNGYLNEKQTIACLSYKTEMGNPVIFHPDYKKELLDLTGDVGGKKVVKRHIEEVFFVEVKQKRELFDIDEKQDVEKGNEIF